MISFLMWGYTSKERNTITGVKLTYIIVLNTESNSHTQNLFYVLSHLAIDPKLK